MRGKSPRIRKKAAMMVTDPAKMRPVRMLKAVGAREKRRGTGVEENIMLHAIMTHRNQNLATKWVYTKIDYILRIDVYIKIILLLGKGRSGSGKAGKGSGKGSRGGKGNEKGLIKPLRYEFNTMSFKIEKHLEIMQI